MNLVKTFFIGAGFALLACSIIAGIFIASFGAGLGAGLIIQEFTSPYSDLPEIVAVVTIIVTFIVIVGGLAYVIDEAIRL